MKALLGITSALALLAIACSGITVRLPNVQELELSRVKTTTLEEPLPDGDEPVQISLAMSAGDLTLRGGAQGLVEGSVDCNVPAWDVVVLRGLNRIDIRQESSNGYTAPTTGSIINEWDVRLGNHPIDLKLAAGAYKGTLDLSGIPLRTLEVVDGASESEVVFSSPNPEVMRELTYRTGASTVALRGLGNARAERITVMSGAGTYTFDFTGTGGQPTRVSIRSGVSTVRIIVPADAKARLSLGGGLQDVSASGGWTGSGTFYTVAGEGTEIELDVDMGVGQLILETR